MNKFANSNHERIYFEKLQYLLVSKTFNDITFNCKDGKTSGNRLILAVYSNFLTDIFKENPLLMEHPLYGPPDSGINLPEVHFKDVDCLLQVLNTSNYFEMSKDLLKGLYHVAKQLQIELIVDKLSSSVVRVQAVPKELDASVNRLVNNVNVTVKSETNCYKSLMDPRSNEDYGSEVEDGYTNSPDMPNNLSGSEEMDLSKSPSKLVVKSELVPVDGEERHHLDGSLEEENGIAFGKVCPVCKITCKTATGLKIHIGHAHRDNDNAEEDEEKRKPVCKCGKIFSLSARKLFREHREKCIAYRRAAFICEICESPFLSMPSLSIHLTAIHGVSKEQRQCLCGATFGSSYSYRKHAIACDAYKRAAIFCEFCNLPFLTNGHLTQHLHSSHRNKVKKV